MVIQDSNGVRHECACKLDTKVGDYVIIQKPDGSYVSGLVTRCLGETSFNKITHKLKECPEDTVRYTIGVRFPHNSQVYNYFSPVALPSGHLVVVDSPYSGHTVVTVASSPMTSRGANKSIIAYAEFDTEHLEQDIEIFEERIRNHEENYREWSITFLGFTFTMREKM